VLGDIEGCASMADGEERWTFIVMTAHVDGGGGSKISGDSEGTLACWELVFGIDNCLILE